MKVLVSTFPAPSHYFPMVPVCWALRASGQEIRVACPASFADVVIASGVPAVAVPEVDLAAFWRARSAVPPPPGQPPAAARSARAMAMFTAVAASTAPPLTEIARRWQADLVICEPRAYAGLLAAAAIGVPAARHLYGIDYTYLRAEQDRDALLRLADASGSWRGDGLGDLTIDPCPPSMQVPAPLARLRVRYVPYNGPGTVPGWVLEPKRRPRICITLGTTHARKDDELSPARTAIGALADLDADLVAAIPADAAERLGPGRSRLAAAGPLPLHLLLPSCDVIIHHGGPGTTLTALTCGTPQLVLPDVADRFLHADQVAAAGAGRVLRRADADPASIRECVLDLLADPRYRQGAQRLQAEAAAQPTPAAAVGALISLATGKVPANPGPGNPGPGNPGPGNPGLANLRAANPGPANGVGTGADPRLAAAAAAQPRQGRV